MPDTYIMHHASIRVLRAFWLIPPHSLAPRQAAQPAPGAACSDMSEASIASALADAIIGSVAPPSDATAVHKSECAFSFVTPEDPGGLYLNLRTFTAVSKEFLSADLGSASGAAYLHMRSTKKVKPSTAAAQITKVAVGVEGGAPTEAIEWDHHYALVVMPAGRRVELTGAIPHPELSDKVNMFISRLIEHDDASRQVRTCMGFCAFWFPIVPLWQGPRREQRACHGSEWSASAVVQQCALQMPTLPLSRPPVPVVLCCLAVLSTPQEEVKASSWEFKAATSAFAAGLPVVERPPKISPDPSTWKCAMCDMRDNLWLNLSTGLIGCGRRQWDGSGGNSHALEMFNETGKQYPLCVKLGTITAEGADVFSYHPSEDDLVSTAAPATGKAITVTHSSIVASSFPPSTCTLRLLPCALALRRWWTHTSASTWSASAST